MCVMLVLVVDAAAAAAAAYVIISGGEEEEEDEMERCNVRVEFMGQSKGVAGFSMSVTAMVVIELTVGGWISLKALGSVPQNIASAASLPNLFSQISLEVGDVDDGNVEVGIPNMEPNNLLISKRQGVDSGSSTYGSVYRANVHTSNFYSPVNH